MENSQLIISRKRKKYKFAQFAKLENCFELEQISAVDLNQAQIVEIGAGTADFSLALAEQYPEKQLLALDIKGDRLQAGAKKALEAGFDNLKFIRAYVEAFDERLTEPNLEQLWITFCDPYPKERSAKHRLTHCNYLKLYQRWLKNGKLYFKTDNQGLFDFSIEELKANDWQILEISRDLHNSDLPQIYKQTTNYERRYLAEGKLIYFLKAEFKDSV